MILPSSHLIRSLPRIWWGMFSELRILSDTDCERCASIELARCLNFSSEPLYACCSNSRSLTDEVDVRPLFWKFRETLVSSGSSGIEVCCAISCCEFCVSYMPRLFFDGVFLLCCEWIDLFLTICWVRGLGLPAPSSSPPDSALPFLFEVWFCFDDEKHTCDPALFSPVASELLPRDLDLLFLP